MRQRRLWVVWKEDQGAGGEVGIWDGGGGGDTGDKRQEMGDEEQETGETRVTAAEAR